MKKLLYLIVLFGIFTSCHLDNHQYNNQLKNLDAQLEQHPEMVWDSLKKIKVNKLNKAQSAYYHLLNASATDKNLIPIENDSTLVLALEYFTEEEDYYNIARCQYYLGKYKHQQEQTKKAFELFKKAEHNANQSDENIDHLLGLIYYQQGLILKQEYNYPEAEKLFQQSYDKLFQTKDTISATYSLKLIGIIQLQQKNYEEAEKYLNKGLQLINSVNDLSNKKLKAKEAILYSFSSYYLQINDLKNSSYYLNEYLTSIISKKQAIPSGYFYNLMCLKQKQAKQDSAKICCLKLIETSKNENNINNIIIGYKYLSFFEQKEGNFTQASSLNKRIEQLKDSLLEKLHQNNILELERKYNTAEAKRLVLKAENSKLRAYAIITVVLFGLIIIGLPLYKRHKKLKMKCDRLSEAVKHTEWGFLVTKEFITENHIAYDELERMLNRERSLHNINTEFYNRFHEALIQQKANYSGRLFNRLTSFDGTFGAKFQQLFPDFNTDELLMASMIHHQWKTVDMTTIFHASAEALRKRRTRLANKISAKLGKEIDLDEFLSNL